ncbi:hypothetical protein [Halegenticoccus tardaugens]|uniref:hypothetical protein n=1 Tax=Halegenticoccus tardaugens TaxID=2071624 RepID=UPI00100A65A5|nr:hypothetical protein [Halegenticoccus tardaugens]
MTFTVTYHCPHCGTLVGLERDEYLADKAVTPFPFEEWEYATPQENYEEADGVKFVCGKGEAANAAEIGKDEAVTTAEVGEDETTSVVEVDENDSPTEEGADGGCGRAFYLSFVKFEGGEEVDPRKPAEFVEIDPGDRVTGPSGPRGPDGPGGFWS